MRTIVFVLACAACLSRGRRSTPSTNNLRSILLAHSSQQPEDVPHVSNPGSSGKSIVSSRQVKAGSASTPAAAFTSRGPRMQSSLARPPVIDMALTPQSVPSFPQGKDRRNVNVEISPIGEDWRVGTLTGGQKYLWRPTDDPDDPEIKFVKYASKEEEQADDWKIGALSCGQRYLWRETDDSADAEVLLVRKSDGEQENIIEDEWRLDFLPNGKAYLWRLSDDPENPEVMMWKMPNLEELSTPSSENTSYEEHRKEVFEFRRKHFGSEHAYTLQAMNDYLAAQTSAGYQADVKMLREAFELSDEVFGSKHPETLRAISNYAGQEPIQKDILTVSTFVQGREHPETLKAMNNYAVTLAMLDRKEEAAPLHKEVLELTRSIYGSQHPSLLSALKNYAVTCHRLDWNSEAEPVEKELLQRSRIYLRAESIDMLRALNSYAATLSKLGRHEEAEPLNKEVHEIVDKVFGHKHPITIMALHNYAVTIGKLGHEDQAKKLIRKLRTLTSFWKRFKGFGAISKHLGSFCRMEVDEFFKQLEQQQFMMEFENPYA